MLEHCIVRDVLRYLDERHITGRGSDIGAHVWGQDVVFLHKAKPGRIDVHVNTGRSDLDAGLTTTWGGSGAHPTQPGA
jgi:hypothetical protein